MEGGSTAGVLGAAQEPREEPLEREEKKGAGAATADRKGAGGGGMKFRVSARAPHGVGALLLIGGAAVAGAAFVAWRRSRRGRKGGEKQGDQRQPAKDEVLDGGVVEDEKVQGGALVQKLDRSDENLSAGNTEIGSGTLDGKVTEESHLVHKDNEIVVDQSCQDNGHVENFDHVERIDQNSSRNQVEITTHDMCQDNEHVEKLDHVERIDQDSSTNPVKIVMQEMVTVCLSSGNVEKVDQDSSKNNIEEEIAHKDNKNMEASDQRKLSINGPGIIFNKHNDTQEAESMENTPTAQLMMHQELLLDDMVTDTVTETEEGEQCEGTIREEGELGQDEKKALAGLIELASSPAVSSLVKPAEEKGPAFPGLDETGMKIDQDHANGELREHDLISKGVPGLSDTGMKIEQQYANGELREHDLISKGGRAQGGVIATMDRRSPALAILALILAMTIGITFIMRLYAPTRATELQMDLY